MCGGVIQDCFALTISNVHCSSNQAGILLVLLPFLVKYREVALQRVGVLLPKAIALATDGTLQLMLLTDNLVSQAVTPSLD